MHHGRLSAVVSNRLRKDDPGYSCTPVGNGPSRNCGTIQQATLLISLCSSARVESQIGFLHSELGKYSVQNERAEYPGNFINTLLFQWKTKISRIFGDLCPGDAFLEPLTF